MANLAELRAQARDHARQIDALRYASVQDLAARWDVDDELVREIPRAQLPYLALGRSGMRRYDPRDVETYEEKAKRGECAWPGATPQ